MFAGPRTVNRPTGAGMLGLDSVTMRHAIAVSL